MANYEDLQLVWLEAFVRVAESGKRTAVAAELDIHQGTVTKYVQKLEKWLGNRMLVDSGVPARLYPDGETFLPIAKRIIGDLNQFRRLPDFVEPPPPRTLSRGIRPPPVRTPGRTPDSQIE